jgi:hypothetical protein
MNETQIKRFLKPLSAAVLIAAALQLGPAFAQTAGVPVRHKMSASHTPKASALAAIARANPLAGGAEIFENLTEAAPEMGAAAFKKALSEYEKLYPNRQTG